MAGAQLTGEMTKEGLAYAAGKTKVAVAVTSHYAGAAWNPVKQKLDETGATQAAKSGYNVVAENTKQVASALNQKIDANPSLKYAKDMTSTGISATASMVKTGLGTLGGWFGYKAAPA